MATRNVYSGSPWEAKVAFCRAKRVGDAIFVSATAAVDATGLPFAPGDLYLQTRHILDKIDRTLWELGSSLRDVVRTRAFVTDINRVEEFARAHRDVFAGIDPVLTCMEVTRLLLPEFVVAIEVDAVVGAPSSKSALAGRELK